MASKEELACVYAALILQDDEVPITADKINAVIKAANVDVEPFWAGLFAKALEGVDVKVSKILMCSVYLPTSLHTSLSRFLI